MRASAGLLLAALLSLAGCAELLQEIERASDATAGSTPADGLREALRVGTLRAVESLGKTDGYLGSSEVRIPLPGKLDGLARALRSIGAGGVVDEFEVSLNRAAEAAAPLARDVFVDAIRRMTIEDAVTIVRGRSHEATDYLRRGSEPLLAERFRPIVSGKLDAVGATRELGALLDRASRLPFVDETAVDLTDYVTRKALDGLFHELGKEELRIREDPVARTTALLRKYFGQG